MAFHVLFLDMQICRDLKHKFSPQENTVNVGGTWKYVSKWDLGITFLRWHDGMLDGKSSFRTLLQGWQL